MNIRCGENEILYSGTVIAILDQPVTIAFPEQKASLKFIINFAEDTSNKDSVIRTNPIDSRTLEMFFVNFSNPLGTGNTELWNIGNLGNQKLYLNYRVYHIDKLSKTLHYTFYLGKEGSHEQ